MIKKTFAALIATAGLLSAGAALADKPGAGWITIEKAIEVAKTKAGYVEVYEIGADNDGYWEGEGRKADGTVYEFRIDGASGNVLRDQKDQPTLSTH
ncbi:PepSY domain-containing protein [Pseudomonas sp. CCNWLW23]